MLKNKNIFFSEKNISDINYLKNEEIKRSSKSYLIKLINSKKKLKILDVGCGTGINSILLNSLGHEVIGVDLSSEAIKKYKKRGFKGYHMDPSKKINFKDNYFDLIFASEVLEHIVDTNTFLSNLKKKLKSDGRLLISTPNSAFWVYRIFSLIGCTLSEVQHPGHVRFFTKKSLEDNLKYVGFKKINFSSRVMIVILPDIFSNKFQKILSFINFKKELRFKTNKFFWHLSFYYSKSSNFWSDTIFISARK